MNELVTKHFGSMEAVKNYAAATQRATEGIGGSMDGRDILRLDPEEGFFTFGQENTELDPTDYIAVHPFSLHHGYIAFDKKEIAYTVDGDPAEMLFPVTRHLPEFDDLPELEAPKKQRSSGRRGDDDRGPAWRYQLAMHFKIIEGPNAGVDLIYKPTSLGGQRMIRMLSDEITRRMIDGAEDIVPIITLFSESYKSRTYGDKTIWNPKADIVEWAPLDSEELTAPVEPKAKAVAARKDERTAKGDKVDRRGETSRGTALDNIVEWALRGGHADDEPDEDGNEVVEERPRSRRRGAEGDDAEGDTREAASARRERRRPEVAERDSHEPEADDPPVTRSRRTAGRNGAGRDEAERTDSAPRSGRAARSERGGASEPEDGSADVRASEGRRERNARAARRERSRR